MVALQGTRASAYDAGTCRRSHLRTRLLSRRQFARPRPTWRRAAPPPARDFVAGPTPRPSPDDAPPGARPQGLTSRAGMSRVIRCHGVARRRGRPLERHHGTGRTRAQHAPPGAAALVAQPQNARTISLARSIEQRANGASCEPAGWRAHGLESWPRRRRRGPPDGRALCVGVTHARTHETATRARRARPARSGTLTPAQARCRAARRDPSHGESAGDARGAAWIARCVGRAHSNAGPPELHSRVAQPSTCAVSRRRGADCAQRTFILRTSPDERARRSLSSQRPAM
jgi:hypothetical protein